jgi:hypothetical protein
MNELSRIRIAYEAVGGLLRLKWNFRISASKSNSVIAYDAIKDAAP